MFKELSRSSLLTLFILMTVGFTVYFNSLTVPFYLDDFRNITENTSVKIKTLSPSSLYRAAFESPLPNRPVPNVTFAVNYYLHQDDVFWYHVFNIFIHSLTAFVLYLLFGVTLKTPAMSLDIRGVYMVPFLASLLWLVHPLHTGSVTYIVQRMISLAVLFYMASLLCYVKGRMSVYSKSAWTWYLAAGIFALLAFGSKEIAITLPCVILLYEWYFLQDFDRKWLRKILWPGLLLALSVVVLCIVYTGRVDLLASYENRPFTLEERLYTQLRVVLLYVSLIFFPHPGRLNLDHYVSLSRSLFDPYTTFFAAVILALLLIFSIVGAKKQRILTFAILWYLGNLVLESSFISLELIFEHRTYLPSVFVIFAFVYLVFQYVRSEKAFIVMMIMAIALCSYWTHERNITWQDPVAFWSDTAAKSPEKARPFMNLSVALRENGEVDEAIAASKKAISIDPRFVNAYVGLGAAYTSRGDYKRAEKQYLKALQMMPEYAEVYNALGVLYIQQGRVGEAVAAFNENLRLVPGDVHALVNRASSFAYQGNYNLAIADFHRALAEGGRNPDILFNLGITYMRNGEKDKAILVFEEVLQLDPADLQAKARIEQLHSSLKNNN